MKNKTEHQIAHDKNGKIEPVAAASEKRTWENTIFIAEPCELQYFLYNFCSYISDNLTLFRWLRPSHTYKQNYSADPLDVWKSQRPGIWKRTSGREREGTNAALAFRRPTCGWHGRTVCTPRTDSPILSWNIHMVFIYMYYSLDKIAFFFSSSIRLPSQSSYNGMESLQKEEIT